MKCSLYDYFTLYGFIFGLQCVRGWYIMTILVAGLINIETTLKIEAFPLHYEPVRYPFFGVNSTVSGVGYNLAKALTTLGHEVTFLSLIGQDWAAEQVRQALRKIGVADGYIVGQGAQTAQSVIMYDPSGQRMIHTDLKDFQEQTYPLALFEQALKGAQAAVLCNINFTRALLPLAKAAGVLIATDVHAIRDLHDPYNGDYMASADILFQSHEKLPCAPAEWLQQIQQRYNPLVAVIGMGGNGALLAGRDLPLQHIPAVVTRPIVNTIGAGDALFSAFLHGYLTSGDAVAALRQAVIFASYKIGVAGAADGFLNAAELAAWVQRLQG
jgi:ribokinase